MFRCNAVTPFWFSYMYLLENLYNLEKEAFCFLLSAGMKNIGVFSPYNRQMSYWLGFQVLSDIRITNHRGSQHPTDSAIPGPEGPSQWLVCRGDEKRYHHPNPVAGPAAHKEHSHVQTCVSCASWASRLPEIPFRVLGNFSPGVRATSDISKRHS